MTGVGGQREGASQAGLMASLPLARKLELKPSEQKLLFCS